MDKTNMNISLNMNSLQEGSERKDEDEYYLYVETDNFGNFRKINELPPDEIEFHQQEKVYKWESADMELSYPEIRCFETQQGLIHFVQKAFFDTLTGDRDV